MKILALTLLVVGLSASSASAQTISLNANSPTNQGNGTWAGTGTWSMPANTPTVSYEFSKIEVQYMPDGGDTGRVVVCTVNKLVNPWTWTGSDTPGAGTHTLPFRLHYVKRTYNAQGTLLTSQSLYAVVSGSVTVN